MKIKINKIVRAVALVVVIGIGLFCAFVYIYFIGVDTKHHSFESPDGRFTLEMWCNTPFFNTPGNGGCFGGHFRLIDRRNGQLLKKTVHNDPSFHPFHLGLSRIEWHEKIVDIFADSHLKRPTSSIGLPGDIPIPPEYQQNWLQYRFNRAVEHGKIAEVEEYIAQGAQINPGDDAEEIPLHVAVKQQNVDMVRYLLDHGADIHARSKEGETVLHIPSPPPYIQSFEEEAPVLAFLIERGADVNARNNRGETPLLINRSDNEMRYLIEHGADINARRPRPGGTSVLLFKHSNPEIVEYLISKGFTYDLQGDEVKNIIVNAITFHQPEEVRYFIERGTDVNARLPHGRYTPGGSFLNEAVDSVAYKDTQWPLVDYLINKGANVNVPGRDNETPLFTAIWGGNLPLVQYLVDHGADINWVNSQGETPLVKAKKELNSSFGSAKERREIIAYLKEKGARE